MTRRMRFSSNSIAAAALEVPFAGHHVRERKILLLVSVPSALLHHTIPIRVSYQVPSVWTFPPPAKITSALSRRADTRRYVWVRSELMTILFQPVCPNGRDENSQPDV